MATVRHGLHALDPCSGSDSWTHLPATADADGCSGYAFRPALSGDLLMAGSYSGHLRGVAANDGTVAWERNEATDGSLHMEAEYLITIGHKVA